MVKIQQSEPEILNHYIFDLDYIAPKSSPNDVVTEKYLEDNFSFEKTKSDNIVKSSANYIKKYYKPSRNCNFLIQIAVFIFFRSFQIDYITKKVCLTIFLIDFQLLVG